MNAYGFYALQFHHFEDLRYFVVLVLDLVDKLFQEFVAVKFDVFFPIIFCNVTIFIEIKKPEKLLALLLVDVALNPFACIPHIILEQY